MGETGGIVIDWYDEPVESPEEVVARQELWRYCLSLIAQLTDQQRIALALRFGLGPYEPHTYKKIGQRLGCQATRARYVVWRACWLLRRRVLHLPHETAYERWIDET